MTPVLKSKELQINVQANDSRFTLKNVSDRYLVIRGYSTAIHLPRNADDYSISFEDQQELFTALTKLYVEPEDEEEDEEEDEDTLGKFIVVLQRGWVVVGDLSKDGTEFTLTNGSVVRRWGTSKGLGELAIEGPLEETILDPIPDTKFHELTVIMRMKCSDKWI